MLLSRRFHPRFGLVGGFNPKAGFRELSQLLDSVLQATPGLHPEFRLSEGKDRFILEARLPGMRPEDIKITVQGKTLYLEGERKAPPVDESCRFHRRERFFGAFNRAITLPAEVDVSKVTAKQQNGILRIELPKDEAIMPREIKVN